MGDLDEAVGWLIEKSGDPALGTSLRRLFSSETRWIQRNALVPRIVYKRFRKVVLRPFKYLLFYRIHRNTVVIVLMVHGARDPRFIREQLRVRD